MSGGDPCFEIAVGKVAVRLLFRVILIWTGARQWRQVRGNGNTQLGLSLQRLASEQNSWAPVWVLSAVAILALSCAPCLGPLYLSQRWKSGQFRLETESRSATLTLTFPERRSLATKWASYRLPDCSQGGTILKIASPACCLCFET